MAFHRSIRNRRGRRKITKAFDLQLTSMMDVLVIILIFLLKSSTSSTHSFTTLPGVQIPLSSSPDVPPDSHHVIITPEAITFENRRIMDFVQTADSVGSEEPTYTFKKGDLDTGGRRILPLFDALTEAKENSERLRSQSEARDAAGKPLPFDGVLAIQADKRVNYDILRRVMFTAGDAGYRVFRFLAVRKDQ